MWQERGCNNDSAARTKIQSKGSLSEHKPRAQVWAPGGSTDLVTISASLSGVFQDALPETGESLLSLQECGKQKHDENRDDEWVSQDTVPASNS